MGKWIFSMLGSIAAGVIVFYVTEGRLDSVSEPEPVPISKPEAEPVPEAEAEPEATISDITGNWAGNLYQSNQRGDFIRYGYELNLFQEGNSIEGNAILQASSGHVSKWKIRGTFDSNVFEYDDVQMLFNNAPQHFLIWCQKSAILNYNEINNALEGQWFQNGCGSGQISLSKFIQ